jgi:hypothetical protein
MRVITLFLLASRAWSRGANNAKDATPMSLWDKLKHEFKSVMVATLFFAAWFLTMVVIKTLILAEHQIEFSGFLKALVGAAVIGKVVLVLENVPLGSWIRKQPAWLNVWVRTLLYMSGVFLVLLGERMFEERHEHAGFSASLVGAFESANAANVWAKTLWVGFGLLVFNSFTVIRQRLGSAALLRLFTSPVPEHPHPSGLD